MFSKFLEGLSLVMGMCILMHALFAEDRSRTPARHPIMIEGNRGAVSSKRRAAYLAFGGSLLIYGLAGVVLRGM